MEKWTGSIKNDNISKIDDKTTGQINIKILENVELSILLFLAPHRGRRQSEPRQHRMDRMDRSHRHQQHQQQNHWQKTHQNDPEHCAERPPTLESRIEAS